MSLRCWAFAWLNDYANGDEANFTFVQTTDLNTWIAGSHGFVYSSMRATGSISESILLQSEHLIDTLTSIHVNEWNTLDDMFLASNFMQFLKEKCKSSPDLQESWIFTENCSKMYWCKSIKKLYDTKSQQCLVQMDIVCKVNVVRVVKSIHDDVNE